jgi:UDP-glucose 4-epimerase
MRDTAADPLVEFRRVNTDGTRRLASYAASCGVRRFVYVSTVKVNGECTHKGGRFSEADPPNPFDAYAISKYEAESLLREIEVETGMEVVIVRPPIVYGPCVKGNFLSMLRCISRRVPLPLASVQNVRSLVGLDNLCDLLMRCVEHPRAAGETFLVSDGEDLSTPALLSRLGLAMKIRVPLFPVPAPALRFSLRAARMTAAYERLCGSLVVDSSKARTVLGWRPPKTVDEGLRQTTEWYVKEAR